MPFEGDKHLGTIILLPYRKDTWRKDAIPALKEYKNVILAIAKYEKVYVGIHPRIYEKVINQFENIDNVIPLKIKYNDAWARDTAPIFVRNNKELRAVDFRFNAYGGDVDGLYSNYKDDDALTKNIAKYFNINRYDIEKFNLEVMYNILWTLAKNADNSIPEPLEWLDSFEEFPVFDIFSQIEEILSNDLKIDRKNA